MKEYRVRLRVEGYCSIDIDAEDEQSACDAALGEFTDGFHDLDSGLTAFKSSVERIDEDDEDEDDYDDWDEDEEDDEEY